MKLLQKHTTFCPNYHHEIEQIEFTDKLTKIIRVIKMKILHKLSLKVREKL